MKFSPIRDTISTVIGAASGGVGLLGTAAKKFLIAKDDPFIKRFGIGLGLTVITGGAALLPYLIAKAGQETKAELTAARAGHVDERY